MKKLKRLSAFLLAAVLAGAMGAPAWAKEERTKIDRVHLNFSAYDEDDNSDYGAVEVTAGSGAYSVDDVEFLSSAGDSVKYPRLKVTLYADHDYYFTSTGKSYFELNGEGAAYASASMRDSKSQLILTVTLKDYTGAQIDDTDSVEWDYEGGGSWSEVNNAGYYEVRLKRGGTTIGDIQRVYDTSFNFASMISQTGTYQFQVRAVNAFVPANKSRWASSENWRINSDTLRELGFHSSNNTITDNSGSSGPTVSSGKGPTGAISGWQKNNTGYWYRNYDGTWPASRWQQIDGFWYYFNKDGYMIANQWLHHTDNCWYYLGGNGRMLTNTRTPDNYYVNANGVWIPGA